jgi:hypothetical protein
VEEIAARHVSAIDCIIMVNGATKYNHYSLHAHDWLSLNMHLLLFYKTRSKSLELLAEEDHLHLVVHGDDTGTGNTSENVGTAASEERSNTLGLDNLDTAVEGRRVLDASSGGHHHSSSDGIERVRGGRSTGGDGPSEQEGGEEVALKRTNENNGLKGVVETEVQTSVDNDTDNGDTETSVETGNTVGGNGLSVDIDQTVELSLTSGLTVLSDGLGIVGKSGSGEIKRVDKGKRGGTGKTTGSKVTHHPHPVALGLLEAEHLLELVLEGKVKSLSGEVSDDVGGVSSPERNNTLLGGGSLEAVNDTGVGSRKSALLDHLLLVLDEELDSLNRSSSGLRDGGGNTAHHEVNKEVGHCVGMWRDA